MKKIIFIALLLTSGSMIAQLPNTEIWLFKCGTASGLYEVRDGANITNTSGYDNQPSFSENGSYMLFTGNRDSNETDIFRYSLIDKATTRVTKTAYSEYSPTYMTGNKYISSVVVEKDSVQRLWRFGKTSGIGQVMVPKVYQVGYHCWFDANTLFFFQVTEPAVLLLYDTKSGVSKIVAENIGRCMQTYHSPKMKLLLYTTVDTSGTYWIKSMSGLGVKDITFNPIKMVGESQDFSVDLNGNLLMCDGTKLYQWSIGKSTAWSLLTDLSTYGLHKITRMAISPDRTHIAFVDNL